ncbi:hypothetical protein, partial [Streptomyces sp. NPDC056632]|uniref:hypothetical protein n=1 Tax=Streptomyces sp. NPDC056632 TaxID=3345884 RepID=UPI0036ACB03D
VTQATTLQNRAVELDFRLDTTRTDQLSQAVTDARDAGRLTDAQTALHELRDLVAAAGRQAFRDPLDDVIGEAAKEQGLKPVELRRRLDEAVSEVQGLESRALRLSAHLSPGLSSEVEELFMAVVNARPAGRLDDAESALIQLRAIVDLAEKAAQREPLDEQAETVATELGVSAVQLRQQLDQAWQESRELSHKAVGLQAYLDTTHTDALSQKVTEARDAGRLTDAQTALNELRGIVTAADEASRTPFPHNDQPRTTDPDHHDSQQQSIADILSGGTDRTTERTTDTDEFFGAVQTHIPDRPEETDEFFDALETQEDAPDNEESIPLTPPRRTVDSISLPDPDDLQALLDNVGNTGETQAETLTRPEAHPEFADTGIEGYARRFHKGTGPNIQELWDLASLVVAAGRPEITVDSTLGPDELRETNPSYYREVITTAQQLNPLLTSADRQSVVSGAASAGLSMPPVGPDSEQSLDRLADVVDTAALREFAAGPYQENGGARQTLARTLTADIYDDTTTAWDTGTPLAYWATAAIAQQLAALTGPPTPTHLTALADARTLAHRIKDHTQGQSQDTPTQPRTADDTAPQTPAEPTSGVTSLPALHKLAAVLDVDALRAFEAGPYQKLDPARRLAAREIVARTIHFGLTIADKGEGLEARNPLEYWTIAAVAQKLT